MNRIKLVQVQEFFFHFEVVGALNTHQQQWVITDPGRIQPILIWRRSTCGFKKKGGKRKSIPYIKYKKIFPLKNKRE